MSVRWNLRVSAALITSVTLTACFPPFWPFPPFFPFDAGPAMGEETLIVENTTGEDWVLSVTGDFPTAFAIPAGETGEIVLYDVAPTAVALLNVDCSEVEELTWDERFVGVRISAPATLTGLEEAGDDDPNYFVEYWECGVGAAPSAADPLPGGTGSLLVIGGDGSGWTLDVATGDLAPLASADDFAAEYAWSPDGMQVAFSAYADSGASTVHLAAADGSDERVLVEDAASPAWSPDGTRIAYLNLDPFAGGSTLSVIDVGGRNSVALADDVMAFRWSPDGTRIGFISGDPLALDPFDVPPSELRVVNADGSGLDTLAEAAPYSYAPAWSPDGTRLAFTAVADGASGDPFTQATVVQLYNFSDGSVRTVADLDDASLGELAWSPDGTRLAFTVSSLSPFTTFGSVGLTSADGGSTEEIGRLEGAYYAAPVWSPDGAWIAVTRSVGDDLTSSLVAIGSDGGDEVILATGVLYAPEWRAGP